MNDKYQLVGRVAVWLAAAGCCAAAVAGCSAGTNGSGLSSNFGSSAPPATPPTTTAAPAGAGTAASAKTDGKAPAPRLIVFVSNRDGNQEIYRLNVDGSNLARLTNNAAADYSPVLSPDGGSVAFVSTREGIQQIFVMSTSDGSGAKRLTTGLVTCTNPMWSADGKSMDYVGTQGAQRQMYQVKLDGLEQTRLNRVPLDGSDYSLSPDGKHFLLHATTQVTGAAADSVAVMDADGTHEHVLATTDGPGTHLGAGVAAWRPDGNRIAYSMTRGGNTNIFVMNADGTGVKRLTDESATDTHPAWSLDGTKLAFTSNREGRINKVFVMKADGSEQRQLTHRSLDDADEQPDIK